MGKIAFDIMEHKRVNREYKREQYMKSLHIVKNNDDISEVIFKMFEQMRLLNEDLTNHLEI